MSCAFFFEHKNRVLLVKFGRALTRESLVEMRDAVRRFVAAEGPCHGILDLSAVAEVNVASDFIAAFGRQRAVLHGRRRILVAPKDEVFGLSRMFGLNQADSGEEPLVVRSLTEAFAALGVAAQDFAPVDVDSLAAPESGSAAGKPR